MVGVLARIWRGRRVITMGVLAMIMMIAVFLGGVGARPVLAARCGEGQVETSLLGENGCADVGKEGEGIFMVLNIVLTVMTYGVGILATVGIVIAGYQYLTAKDDVAKMQKAKDRILQVVIGLVLYGLLWTVLEFLLPGGIFGG